MGQKAITDKRYFYFSEVYEKDNIDGILRGAAAQASEESDRFISAAVRSNLFRNVDPHGLGTDLAARKIQRGHLPGAGVRTGRGTRHGSQLLTRTWTRCS